MLSTAQLAEIINNNDKVIVKAWMQNCPFCVQYSPIFDQSAGSHEGIAFTSIENTKIETSFAAQHSIDLSSLPVTLIFEKGQLKAQAKGLMNLEQLNEFIATGKQPQRKEPDPQEWVVS